MFLEFTPNVIISFLSRGYVEAAPSAIYPPHKKAQKKVSRTDGRTRTEDESAKGYDFPP